MLRRRQPSQGIFQGSMLLQPLVENAIVHGFYLEGAEKKIQITISENEFSYIIEVEDFGLKQEANESKSNRKSYGMDIVAKRIRLHNGNKFEFEEFEAGFKDGNGYKVAIILRKK